MMKRVRISQMSALLLEHARSFGYSDEQLLDWIDRNDMDALQGAEDDFYKYADWVNYAREYGEDLQAAVREGYQMTFNTVYGLTRWLEQRLGAVSGEQYTPGEGRMDHLKVSEQEMDMLKQTLATNWAVVESDEATVDETGKHEISLVMRALLVANNHL